MEKVDHSYTFAPPHRITLSLPSASHKVLADVTPEKLELSWSFRSLRDSVYNVWQAPEIDWKLRVQLIVDGSPAHFCRWQREKGGVPAFILHAEHGGAAVELYGTAAETGSVVRIRAACTDGAPHTLTVAVQHTNGWVISNPAWIDGADPNLLTCMQNDKADRILALAYGADEYPVPRNADSMDPSQVPMGDMGAADGSILPQKSILAVFHLSDTAQRTGYLLLPYKKYRFSDLPALNELKPEKELTEAVQLWKTYLGSHAQLLLPDEAVSDAFLAALADLFVMREALDDTTFSVTCGTQVYRSPNDAEPTIADGIFDRLGFLQEVEQDLPVHLGYAGSDGNWNNPRGWMMTIWGGAGFKARLAYSHYLLTQDTDFLQQIYPTMLANARWQRKMRLSTQNDVNPSCRGLMPRGMGDCGMKAGNDYFGVFYPHNFQALQADRLTLAAAQVLGYTQDAAELEEWITEASAALESSLRQEAVEENGRLHIPSGPEAKVNTSRYGSLDAYFAGVLNAEDPLLQSTLQWMEEKISTGGLPEDLGWMKNGLWVAIALDNLSALYLRENKGDEAVKYLYPTINHATPFGTWCEERGSEAASKETSGDLQHLWTPCALCVYLLDALCLPTKNGLRLASGIPRFWLEKGKAIGVKELQVPGGTLTYTLHRTDEHTLQLEISTSGQAGKGTVEIPLRLPSPREIVDLLPKGCTAIAQKDTVYLQLQEAAAQLTIRLY